MKSILKISAILLFSLCISLHHLFSQTVLHSEGKFNYETVENDPLKSRIYKLDNGLTVYMTVYKDEPRIQTYIPVKAGSKMDPADATGLAHYLEHMLFKGTDKFGTKDFSKEKPLIDEIINLYEVYRKTTDINLRKSIYHQIDSVSGIAAKYAIANEYDKMMNIIGATGTNAFTSVEETVYENEIPSNQLEKWLIIESERYRAPVMRLFHTELEAVYEEKNIGLDKDDNKAWEALFAGLFPTHQYGTQTTIGTIEHLKNPSIKKVIEYYNEHYVPNNMAICISGDFDPDEAISLIDKYWGQKISKPVPEYIPPVEKPITSPVIKDVYGPDAEMLYIGYRFEGDNTCDADMITLIDMMLSNSTAGLLDLNLNQSQKVLESGSFTVPYKDYSAHILSGKPRNGQSLNEVKDLLLSQIELIKKGDFPDWLPEASITNMKLERIKEYESNSSRAFAFVNAFVKGIKWENEVNKIDRISKITKQEIIDFANSHYSENYVVLYKHKGEDKNVIKVEKPVITPVEVNRQDQSAFVKSISDMPASDIEPVFIDYKKDIIETSVKENIPMYYKENTENGIFTLSYIVDIGNNNDKRLETAASYFDYLGTTKLSPSQVKQEFYKLGCSGSVSASDEQTTLSISGLNENFTKAIILFENVIGDLQPEKDALDNLVRDVLKNREDDKLSKEKILWSAMYSYGKYGKNSPFANILSESELKSINPEELVLLLKSLLSYSQKITYYGPLSPDSVSAILNQYHNSSEQLKETPPAKQYIELPTTENTVYIVNYSGMVQAEILFLSKKEGYNNNLAPIISMYNEYFGGGMSGIVFQDLRESKALAYSTFSSFTIPKKKELSHYNIAYIGAQADKLPEAMSGMMSLLSDLPESELTYNSAKNNLIQKLKTERITRSNIISSYLAARKLGLDYDIRKDIYGKADLITLNDVKKFQKNYIKDSKYTIFVLGDKSKLNLKILQKYGKIKYLTLEDIFGY